MPGKPIEILKRSLTEFGEDDCPMMASSLAYYTVFSLPPLLFIAVATAGAIFGPAAVEREVLDQITEAIGPAAAAQIQTMLRYTAESTAEGGWMLIVGIGALAFAATGVLVQLQAALNRAWDVRADPDAGGVRAFLGKRLNSFGMLLGIAFVLIVSLVISALLAAASDFAAGLLPESMSSTILRAVALAANVAVFTGIFAAMYRYLPDAKIEWQDVWAGALATAILFEVGKAALAWYVGRSDVGEGFGAAGSLAVVMLWSYYAAMILLYGAEFTEAWAWARGRAIVPEPGAIRVKRTEVRDYSPAGRP